MSATNNQQWQVIEAEAGLRLDKWLAAPDRLGSRARAFDAITKGKIFVNEVEQTYTDAARKVAAGERVRLWMDRPGSSERKFTERHQSGLHIIYEDGALLVIDKPAGLLTVPLPGERLETSLLDRLKEHLGPRGKQQPLVVHRIDRDTSGLVIFAKNFPAQQALKTQFEQRQAERIYLAVAQGVPRPEQGEWRDLLEWNQEQLRQQVVERRGRKTQEAVCHYRVIKTLRAASLLEVRLVTGKRNQIRIQASLRGHPLLGEKMYTNENAPAAPIKFGRQALHAHRLQFKHPADRRVLKFEVAPPPDFAQLLEKLGQR